MTLWLLSTDNLNRPADELVPLLKIIENTVTGLVDEGWRVNPMGALDLLPDDMTRTLKHAAEVTADKPGLLVNVAVCYGGRREIADAVRSLLYEHASRGTTIEELAEILDVEHIAEHLYTAGQPDPDLVIRTSGEQRLGGFLLWQSTHSEFTSATRTGLPSAGSTSFGLFGHTPNVTAGSAHSLRKVTDVKDFNTTPITGTFRVGGRLPAVCHGRPPVRSRVARGPAWPSSWGRPRSV